MIFKIPLYFEVEGGINPQNSADVINLLTIALEEYIMENLAGKVSKNFAGETLQKEIRLAKDVKTAMENFVGKGGIISFIRREEAKRKLISTMK